MMMMMVKICLQVHWIAKETESRRFPDSEIQTNGWEDKNLIDWLTFLNVNCAFI